MTFLEYVIERMLGAPYRTDGKQSWWVCPFCGDDTAFATLPRKDHYKDRCKCHSCGKLADEHDFLKEGCAIMDYSERQELLLKFREAYAKTARPVPPPQLPAESGVPLLLRLLKDKTIDELDLLEVVSELKMKRQLAMEWKKFGRKRKGGRRTVVGKR